LTGNRAARDIAARWHALIGTLYCFRDDGKRARLEINRGLTIDSKHRELILMAGVLVEHGVCRSGGCQAGLNLHNLSSWQSSELQTRAFGPVVEDYRAILSREPAFHEARLRLGRVLQLNNSPRESRDQLAQVATGATREDLRYLAHLFLGS